MVACSEPVLSVGLTSNSVLARSNSARSIRICLLWCLVILTGGASLSAQPPSDQTAVAPSEELVDTTAQDTAVETIPGIQTDPGKDTVRYESETIEYDMERKMLHLVENAVVRYQDVTLYADTIVYMIDENLFIASGSPQLVEGGDTTVGEYMTYNINTRRGHLQYASTHMDEAYFNSRRVVKAKDNTFHAHHGDYTTCAYPELPHYYFYAKDIKFIPNDKIYARPAVFNIGGVPVGALPYIILPVDRSRSSGVLTPRFGGNPGSNFYLDNLGYYWAINEYVDLTVSGKVEEFREYVAKASSRYALRYWLDGGISTRYSRTERYDRDSQEWALDYSHNQILTPDGTFTLSGRGNLVSSNDFYSDFSEDTTELLSRQLSANLSLSKRFPGINASSQLNWNRDHNLQTNIITEEFPRFSFNLFDRPLIPLKQSSPMGLATEEELKPKWYNKVSYSYNARGIRKHYVAPEAILPEERDYYRSGIDQGFRAGFNQSVFEHFNVRAGFDFNSFLMDAFKDTIPDDTLIEVDTTFDTLSVEFLADTTIILDTIVLTDELNYTDTMFIVVKEFDPDTSIRFRSTEEWSGDYTWSASAGLDTRLYGIFPVRFLNYTGFRHTLVPSVSYRYSPRNETERNRIYENIGIRTTRESPMTQSVAFSVGNTFDGKRLVGVAQGEEEQEEKSFTMLTSNMGITYGFNPQDSMWRWSDLGISASIPNNFFNVSMQSSFWVYDESDQLSLPILNRYSINLSPRFNVGATGALWGGDKMVFAGVAPVSQDPVEYGNAGMQQLQFSLRPSYSFTMSRTTPGEDFTTTKRYNLSASANMNFTRQWYVSWGSYYDFLENEFVGHNLSFRADLECWDMRFNWSPSGINPGFYFLIQIKKIPEVKWELND